MLSHLGSKIVMGAMSWWHIPLPNMKQVMEAPFTVSVLHFRCYLQQCLGQTPEDIHPQERCEMCGAAVLRPHRNRASNSPVDLLTPKVLPSCSQLCSDRATRLCSILPCRTARLNCNSSRWPGIELEGSRSAAHRYS